MNENLYNCLYSNHSLFKYFKKEKKRQINYDIENTIKLKAPEVSIDIDIKIESRKRMIIEKIYFMILIIIGIMIVIHIIHFILSDYVRNFFNKNNL